LARLLIREIADGEIEEPSYIYTTFSHSFIASFHTKLPKYPIEVNPLIWFTK
jgi:hypothetical protein